MDRSTRSSNEPVPRSNSMEPKRGNCLRVSVALEEAEIPYIVRRKLDLRRSEHRTPEHLSRKSRTRKVPTLVERFRDGRVLTLSQSNAILMYAAEGSPPRLLPSDTAERALVLQRFFYFVNDVIAVSHAGSRPRTMEAISHSWDGQSLGALAFAESFLENSTFMAGEAFSLADIGSFHDSFVISVPAGVGSTSENAALV